MTAGTTRAWGVPVAEVVRSGFVESVHHGSVVALDPSGAVVLALGDPDRSVFPRSCLKPLQAVAMVRAGLDLDGPQLALVAASHNGEDAHVAIAESILAGAGLSAAALHNTPGLPLHEATARRIVCAGGGPDHLRQNCSGKHAGMLATCVATGWPLDGYLDLAHPLQVAIRTTVEELSGERVDTIGVDGCGAPVFAISLMAVARAYARIGTSPPGSAEARVAAAMRTHPDVVAGTGRDVTRLMTDVRGLLAKDGAEGACAAVLADGSALAVKVSDGTGRARTPVVVAALRRLGRTDPVLDELATTPVLGGGHPVGEIRSVI